MYTHSKSPALQQQHRNKVTAINVVALIITTTFVY